MCLQKKSLGINVEVNAYIFLEGGFKLRFQGFNKFTDPLVAFVVFLAVGYEDVVIRNLE